MRLGAKAEEGAGLAPPGGGSPCTAQPRGAPHTLGRGPIAPVLPGSLLPLPPSLEDPCGTLGPPPTDDRGHWPVPRPLLTPKGRTPCARPVRSHPRVPVTPAKRKKRKRARACSPVERGWPGVQGQADARSHPPASRHLGAAGPLGMGTGSTPASASSGWRPSDGAPLPQGTEKAFSGSAAGTTGSS